MTSSFPLKAFKLLGKVDKPYHSTTKKPAGLGGSWASFWSDNGDWLQLKVK
jgi:hypothetical protein